MFSTSLEWRRAVDYDNISAMVAADDGAAMACCRQYWPSGLYGVDKRNVRGEQRRAGESRGEQGESSGERRGERWRAMENSGDKRRLVESQLCLIQAYGVSQYSQH
jgi:hypothetical protein